MIDGCQIRLCIGFEKFVQYDEFFIQIN